MTMIGDTSDQTMALLQFVQQLRARKEEARREQAINLLNTLQPGETLASVLGAPKAYERATGAKADPNRVLKPLTPQDVENKQDVTTILGLSPEQQTALAKNRIINRALSTTGPQTTESFAAAGREVTATAQAKATTAEAANVAVQTGRPAATPQEARNRATGERQIFGQTRAETSAASLGGETAEKYAKFANDFLADPENSSWGKMMASYGLDPKGVTEAFASGQGSTMSGMLQLKGAVLSAAGDIEKLKLGSKLRTREELDAARIEAAKTMSTTLGGRLGTRTILSLENAVESGQDPYKIGVAAGDVAAWLKAREIGMGSYVHTQIEKDNPQSALVKGLINNMKTFPDVDQMTAANTVLSQVSAQMVTEGEYGPRPDKGSVNNLGIDQETWDARARYNYSTLGIIGKNARHWAKDIPGITQNPPFATPSAGVDTTKAGGKTATTGKPGTPTFVDPSAARAAQAAVQLGQDSSLIKR